jgi:hypothetical protein
VVTDPSQAANPYGAAADTVAPIASQGTALTIRIRKSSADALASGKLSEKEFLKEAEATGYFLPAALNDSFGPNYRYPVDLQKK